MNLYLSTSGEINSEIMSYMRYGDIIVVYLENKLYWGIIDDFIKVSKLKVYEIISVSSGPNCSDKFVFSYDAISNRSGDKEMMLYLQQTFTNKHIKSFINNLFDILFYKDDRIDYKIYTNLFKMMYRYHEITIHHLKNEPYIQEKILNKKNIKENIIKNITFKENPESYIFYDYLDIKCQNIWHKYYHYEEYKMRDIFKMIRKTYPLLFSLALKNFNINNIHGNIYKLKTNNTDI